MKKISQFFPHFLLLFYIFLFIICAIHPHDRSVWWAENIPVLLVVILLVATFQKFRFSNFSYALMSLWIYLHTIGGHYTFELVPFDFVNNLFGWERNMFDRIAHMIIGFYSYPILEFLSRKKLIENKTLLIIFGIIAILALA